MKKLFLIDGDNIPPNDMRLFIARVSGLMPYQCLFHVFVNEMGIDTWRPIKKEFGYSILINKVPVQPDSADIWLACFASRYHMEGYLDFILISSDKMIFSVHDYLIDNDCRVKIITTKLDSHKNDYLSNFIFCESLNDINQITIIDDILTQD